MTDHGARDHATWSASSTARNVHCAGALTLAQFAPPDKESIHAARGTACHQIAEKCLRTGADAIDFLGAVEKTKEHEIEIDEELINSAQEYVDYVRKQRDRYEPHIGEPLRLWLEERFALDDLNPPFDAGGTGDAVLYCAETNELEIVDLKNGMGVVDIRDNPQLRTYALGALLAHPGLDVETVTVTIVQPRAPHKDGRIRSETFHVADLMSWTADLLGAMHRSKTAMDEYAVAGSNSVLLDEWAAKWLNPGKCTFCPAEATCPALRKAALDVAKVWFEPDTGEAQIANRPTDMSAEALGQTLDMLPMLENWVKAVRGYAHAQAENGVAIPGYQLSDKIGFRKWTDEEAVKDALIVAGVPIDEMHVEPKLKSPAQMEKLLGAKRKALIEPFTERPVTGANLVSVTKTSRPPAKTKPETWFEKEGA